MMKCLTKDEPERIYPNRATIPEFDWKLMITIKSLIQDSMCSDRDSERDRPEYKVPIG